jgi:hypothetical protein
MSQTGKKAILISCSDHYNHRLNVIDICLQKRGYETTYITSDFDHMRKESFVCEIEGCIQLPTKPYKKNLSVARILSHRRFARDTFEYIEGLDVQPDVIVALLPPNFMGHYAAKYKKKHPEIKLVFDIFDMWPETFPGGLVKKILAPAFAVWGFVRNHSLPKADFVITECEMFRELLRLPAETSQTVFLCGTPLDIKEQDVVLREDRVELCYLGSINNVVSIPDICDLISKLVAHKPVTLHIIGTGEQEQALVDGARAAGADVEFYGPIYDDEKKLEIINHCHFGINLMKASACIGLTMKSVDYFRYNLPIINNIPADTKELVEKKGMGLEWNRDCAQKLLSLSLGDCLNMRKNVEKVFAESFALDRILEQHSVVLDKIL